MGISGIGGPSPNYSDYNPQPALNPHQKEAIIRYCEELQNVLNANHSIISVGTFNELKDGLDQLKNILPPQYTQNILGLLNTLENSYDPMNGEGQINLGQLNFINGLLSSWIK